MSMDKSGKLDWTSVINKTQFDDGEDNFLSYALMRSGGELHFLFNEIERRRQLLVEQSVTPDGKIQRNPPLRSRIKGMSLCQDMPNGKCQSNDRAMHLQELYLFRKD